MTPAPVYILNYICILHNLNHVGCDIRGRSSVSGQLILLTKMEWVDLLYIWKYSQREPWPTKYSEYP